MVRKLTIAAALIAAFSLSSCKKDDTLRYNNITMGEVSGDIIMSDNGDIYHVTDCLVDKKYEDGDRIMLNCDILDVLDNTDNEYEIRLNTYYPVLVKDVALSSSITEDDERSIKNPMSVNQIWNSAGYLNLQLLFFHKNKSETQHLVNLVLDEEESKDGKYVFELRHNAYMELPTSITRYDYSMRLGYASFPFDSIIEGESADVRLKWTWYESAVSGISLDQTVEMYVDFKWTRDKTEQAPSEKSTGDISFDKVCQ